MDFKKAHDSVDLGFLEYMNVKGGFCAKWVAWMKVCVCGRRVFILVNGSPIEGINIQTGSKQGDPRALFLFLLVAEGYSGLIRNAVRHNLFKDFEFRWDCMVISHLQHADDSLCIEEATMCNLWMLKAFLRGFDVVSGLKVSCYKSYLGEKREQFN